MSRAESAIVGLFMGIMCPLSLFVLGWWISASVVIYRLLPLRESDIATAAVIGLGLGIVLDLFCLKTWIPRFYSLDARLTVLVYLFWSAMVVAFFMGLPFGNLALGTLAGVYVGRRQRHAGVGGGAFLESARNIGLFTALVTGLEALPIGVLSLHEQIVVETLQAVTGLDQATLTGPIGLGLVGLGCLLLMVVQFWFARTAAALAFRFGRKAAYLGRRDHEKAQNGAREIGKGRGTQG